MELDKRKRPSCEPNNKQLDGSSISPRATKLKQPNQLLQLITATTRSKHHCDPTQNYYIKPSASLNEHQQQIKPCDCVSPEKRNSPKLNTTRLLMAALTAALLLLLAKPSGALNGSILLHDQLLPGGAAHAHVGAHLQPSFVYGARNRSLNLTHLLVDELTGSVYVGATNWLFQLSAANLRPEVALRTGPALENPRDCAPADCLAQLAHVDPHTLPMHHAHGADLAVPPAGPPRRAPNATGSQPSFLARAPAPKAAAAAAAHNNNNYNKILAIEPDSRQLLVCGSLSQGACRKHRLGQLANYSELVPLPVAANDEHSSSVALVSSSRQHKILYVAATNSRLGPYREMVPAISARYLEPASRQMQIIEPSSTDSARVDVSSDLRDYYLVNYVYAFQHNEFVYFATVQRKSPLRQLEESGYTSRLARLCLGDLSFQSYTELTLECRSASGQQQYNLLQDAQLSPAGSHLSQQLGIRHQSGVLATVFAQSKDHTTKSLHKSAVCLFPMDKIEQKFNDNIHMCYNGSSKARNMNYIAGAVNDCPKPGKAGNIANFCNEPLKLNGSIPLVANPVLTYDDQLLTSIVQTQAPSAPLSLAPPADQAQHRRPSLASLRQHQVLLLGTAEGALKRAVVVSGEHGFGLRALEFDSVQLDENHQEPILADLQLLPATNPQLADAPPGPASIQSALVGTASKVVKLRINGCKFAHTANNSSAATDCNQCAQLMDPFCGWCSTAGTCTTRDECLAAAAPAGPTHWSPFDQIKCADYQPLSPQFVALQTSNHQPVDVNVRIQQAHQSASALALHLAQAQFICHFDYLSGANRSAPAPRLSGATTMATQARLNLHTSTVVIACPLPAPLQRPLSDEIAHSGDHLRSKLNVRLALGQRLPAREIQQFLGMTHRGHQQVVNPESGSEFDDADIERELTFYDCSRHASCRTCLSAGSSSSTPAAAAAAKHWSCSWCPLSNKCTFNASHPDLGCAASAIISTTPHLAAPNWLRASHLAHTLDRAQASVLGASVDRLAQCPSEPVAEDLSQSSRAEQPAEERLRATRSEILIPNNARRSVQLSLRTPLVQPPNRRLKIECLFEVEGAKARVAGRLHEGSNNNQVVVCQESSFSYQEEVATQQAQLVVIVNDNQVIDKTDVILYKCHLFGVSPPALTSTMTGTGGMQQSSSAAWRAHELLQLVGGNAENRGGLRVGQSDCSLCLNVERKYQCAWCSNQCQHSEQCNELAASTCPPPRINTIYPNSGPLEGGTLLTIEGSNLGSNEREIQDKITVGGKPCQLVMYSVSTRIVCKTGPSLHGAQAATVFVGNKAGVTSAHEMFHYKAVHLTDVNPRMGPVSGGTRLYLTGSNLNVGSRTQVFLDEIPCYLDSSDITSNQLACVTAPNLLTTSTRITKLTLMIDNSTHHLPYPFTYQPDPIITNIEPAESFLSGGRLILIAGHHLASPQSTKFMVYHEHKHNIINGTSCITRNDTLITCLTPAISRDLIAGLTAQDQTSTTQDSTLSYESGGLKLKMSLFMDDVKSVRNLDDYYHHLPQYFTYYEDPQLFRLPNPVVEFTDELAIPGENLRMKQLDQDMLITIGSHSCPIKSIFPNQILCEPPKRIAPLYDDNANLVERPLLPITALIGSNLRYQIGHMRYLSSQYQFIAPANSLPLPTGSVSTSSEIKTNSMLSSVVNLIILSVVGSLIGFVSSSIYALTKFRQVKAEREYKRIQLQMGSLDVNGQPPNGTLFGHSNKQSHQGHTARSRALDYVGGALSGKKPFYQFNQQLASFPPSPLTDMSSLTGSNPMGQNQHVVKLSSNGTIINSASHQQPHHIYNSTESCSSQSSPGSNRNTNHLFNQNQNNLVHHQHHQLPLQNHSISDKSNLLGVNMNSRNFSWTQEAPSTVLPYAVIEACNLTLEGKNAIKEYV